MPRRAKLLGRDLSDAELETIRVYIESLGAIDVDDALRDLIAQQWPHLLAKLPLRTRPRRTSRKSPREWRAGVRGPIG